LKTRGRAWPRAIAAWLAEQGVRPNAVSVASIGFAAIASISLYGAAPHQRGAPLLYLVAAAAIQLRLLSNLLDGLMAVESNLKSAHGDLFNEIPDRIADALILVAAGYAVASRSGAESSVGPALGWTAALLAVGTAYVRVLAGSLGAPQRFLGPMAKQHRMFALTIACLAAAIEQATRGTNQLLLAALVLIVLGTAVTLVRRVMVLARDMEQR
jgi:phosphatidylglycerophosphate synthase